MNISKFSLASKEKQSFFNMLSHLQSRVTLKLMRVLKVVPDNRTDCACSFYEEKMSVLHANVRFVSEGGLEPLCCTAPHGGVDNKDAGGIISIMSPTQRELL